MGNHKNNNHQPCGHEGMDCGTFVKLIQSILDGEATEAEKQVFEQHINGCNPCSSHFHLDKEFTDFLRQKLQHQCAPVDLEMAVRSKIRLINV